MYALLKLFQKLCLFYFIFCIEWSCIFCVQILWIFPYKYPFTHKIAYTCRHTICINHFPIVLIQFCLRIKTICETLILNESVRFDGYYSQFNHIAVTTIKSGYWAQQQQTKTATENNDEIGITFSTFFIVNCFDRTVFTCSGGTELTK